LCGLIVINSGIALLSMCGSPSRSTANSVDFTHFSSDMSITPGTGRWKVNLKKLDGSVQTIEVHQVSECPAGGTFSLALLVIVI